MVGLVWFGLVWFGLVSWLILSFLLLFFLLFVDQSVSKTRPVTALAG
jgi:hypothetical protein